VNVFSDVLIVVSFLVVSGEGAVVVDRLSLSRWSARSEHERRKPHLPPAPGGRPRGSSVIGRPRGTESVQHSPCCHGSGAPPHERCGERTGRVGLHRDAQCDPHGSTTEDRSGSLPADELTAQLGCRDARRDPGAGGRWP
jgi:hypothetical protein